MVEPGMKHGADTDQREIDSRRIEEDHPQMTRRGADFGERKWDSMESFHF
jgi:hypothetical protein